MAKLMLTTTARSDGANHASAPLILVVDSRRRDYFTRITRSWRSVWCATSGNRIQIPEMSLASVQLGYHLGGEQLQMRQRVMAATPQFPATSDVGRLFMAEVVHAPATVLLRA